MILDAQLEVSNAQSLSGATTTVATNTINVGGNVRFDDYKVAVQVTAAGGTNPTLDIEVFGDTASGFGTEVSVGKRSIAAADLVANKMYFCDIAPGAPYRYYRVKYTQAGTSPTATVSAWFVSEKFQQKSVYLAGVSTP